MSRAAGGRFRNVVIGHALSAISASGEWTLEPIVLFGIQFTLSLIMYGLIGFWYLRPLLAVRPREAAVVPSLLVHAFRVVGGTILAPGAGSRRRPA